MERSNSAEAPVNEATCTLRCPRCQRVQPVHDFAMLGMSPLHASQLVPVYRCGSCSHTFALRPARRSAA